MSESATIPANWSRRRFWWVAAAMFAGQMGWIFLFGERTQPVFHPAAPRAAVRLLDVALDDDRWTKHVFATDPTVFPTSSPHGFADLAWGWLPGNDFAAPLREPPPVFLEYPTNGLGADGTLANTEVRPGPILFAGQSDAMSGAPPPFPEGEASRPGSFARLDGPLASRQIGPPLVLPAWTTNFLVSNSVVHFGVDRAGQVISAGLVTGCGLPDADDAAVTAVSRFRFRPVRASAEEFVWDTATFYWKVVPPRGQ